MADPFSSKSESDKAEHAHSPSDGKYKVKKYKGSYMIDMTDSPAGAAGQQTQDKSADDGLGNKPNYSNGATFDSDADDDDDHDLFEINRRKRERRRKSALPPYFRRRPHHIARSYAQQPFFEQTAHSRDPIGENVALRQRISELQEEIANREYKFDRKITGVHGRNALREIEMDALVRENETLRGEKHRIAAENKELWEQNANLREMNKQLRQRLGKIMRLVDWKKPLFGLGKKGAKTDDIEDVRKKGLNILRD